MPSRPRIKVVIVDDSRLVRELLSSILSEDPSIDVVGCASDPFEARDMIKDTNPDVVTLDIEMPRMDGITFLKNMMRLRPIPVVMISTLTEKGADITLTALECGAVDFLPKPKVQLGTELKKMSADIRAKVKQAARANIRTLGSVSPVKPTTHVVKKTTNPRFELIAIGASTGGTEAIKTVLMGFPSEMPPIVMVQHMPGGFTTSYAMRLDSLLPLTVLELKETELKLQSNHVYLANGDQHLKVSKKANQLYASVDDSAPVNRHKPSVDVMFESVARVCGATSAGIILTGMGMDGANGLLSMRSSGAYTLAQDEETSVVWGMPRVAVELDAAVKVLPLTKIASDLLQACYA